MTGRATELNSKAVLAAQYNQLYQDLTLDDYTTIGSYHIIEEIGEGAFGKVFLAKHMILNQKVVLKCGRKDDPNIVREIYYHKQLKHRNIVNLYEVIKTETRVWLVLEYCGGGELFYYIYDHKRITPEVAKSIFLQVVLAVKYVHSLNLSHRDIKLENILFADSKKTRIKLTDFGFVREVKPRQYLLTICGTLVYMAPEMIKGERYSGISVDIWALGIILYTMVYGELPFDDDNDYQLKQKVIEATPRFLDAIPAQINDLIIRLLAKLPQDRINLNDVLNSPWLIYDYSKYIEKERRAPNDAELIVSIHQHYNTHKTPFQLKIERSILKRLKKLNVDLAELEAAVMKNEMNALTAFYELLLQQEFDKKKQKYLKEKKRRYYEAKRQIRRSLQRVKLVLSLSDQGLINSLGGLSFRNSWRSTDFTRPDPLLLPRARFSRGDTPEATPTAMLPKRDVLFGVIEPQQSLQESTDLHRKWAKDTKIMTKLQFWKKLKRSTDSLDGATLKEKVLNPSLGTSHTSPTVAPVATKNGSYADIVEPVPQMAIPPVLLDSELGATKPEPEKEVLTPQRTASLRRRPLSMMSQVSQISNLSQFSAMTELELDILDELLDDDLSFDEGIYDSSLNNSQDFKTPMTPTSSFLGSIRPRKKRPLYMRNTSDLSSKLRGLSLVSSNSLDESMPNIPDSPRPTLPVSKKGKWKLAMFSGLGWADPVQLGSTNYGGLVVSSKEKGRSSPPVSSLNRLNLRLKRDEPLRLKRHGATPREDVGDKRWIESVIEEEE